ncbi:TetR/AcrR family transcriptional regulator [Streptomyces sp. NPDC004629]|uniref:TetR/AcrR family transcriptional regulator n=1 Tax=Streptomyces sp. NPDC004629 TaxID=3364705 RepID=UPI00368F9CCA
MVRMSADERREVVIRAAIAEFSQRGYYGTSTEAIAKRVGVSQPYLFRLFPGKKAIFAAASLRCVDDVCRVLGEAGEGFEGEEAVHAMARAYVRLIQEQPERLLMQMQTYIAVAAAEAEGDHEFGEAVRAGWMRLWETVHLPLGADDGETTVFLAYGMLINTLAAMGFPPGHRVWQGMYPSARIGGPADGQGN